MPLPRFLEGTTVSPRDYEKWLKRKAKAHCKRDCERGNVTARAGAYREVIRSAVENSAGLCEYTGEALDWTLISTYKNDESKAGRRVYKARFARLPTVDHVGDGLGPPDFVICGWAVNDAKGDLNLADFLTLCKKVLKHHSPLPDPSHGVVA